MQVKQLQQHTATTTRAAILLVASAALLASSGVAASWQRRVYHTDSACKGPFGYGVQVWIPTAPCQAPGSVTASCEIKSTDTRTPSSEGTACDNNPASDSAYFPTPAEASLVSGANYLSVNVYNNQPGQANCFFDASVQVEQTTFAADGKCYAFEAGNYFKASCSATTGQVQFCNDAECKDCKPGGMVFTDTSCKAGTTLPTRMICTGSNTIPPLTPINSTTSAPPVLPAPPPTSAPSTSATAPSGSSPAASGQSTATQQAQRQLVRLTLFLEPL
ncbi:hypothetical protein BASA62_000002 [Batrachochytrium salamandrivorans]|nr:hypothetical protein BASA62_000002 [Batrachochytrium salamandrivorans]